MLRNSLHLRVGDRVVLRCKLSGEITSRGKLNGSYSTPIFEVTHAMGCDYYTPDGLCRHQKSKNLDIISVNGQGVEDGQL